jgi:hypothetical protein
LVAALRVDDAAPPAILPIVETPGSVDTVLYSSSLVAASVSSWGSRRSIVRIIGSASAM